MRDDVPLQMVEEILSYLPTKPLIRFRCVSKAWLHLITSQNHLFVRKHCDAAAAKRKTLVLYGDDDADHLEAKKLCCFPLSATIQQKTTTGSHLVPFPFDAGNYPQLLASCDGLLCVSDDGEKSLYLWNPSIKSHWQVPSPTLTGSSCQLSKFGMGYATTTTGRRDYRLLNLVWDVDNMVTEAHMYTLSSNLWSNPFTKFGPPPGYCPFSNAAFVNGSIHWLFAPTMHRLSSPKPFSLISFHLSSSSSQHQFCREMPLPPEILFWPAPPDCIVRTDLWALDGLLCIHKVSTSRFVLWAMKDYYSDHMSAWAKLIDIDFGEDQIFDSLGNPMRFQPLTMYQNAAGEVLLVAVVTMAGTEL